MNKLIAPDLGLHFIRNLSQLVNCRSGKFSLGQGFAHLPRTGWLEILSAPPMTWFCLGGQQLPGLVHVWEAAPQSSMVLDSVVGGGESPCLPLCWQGFQLKQGVDRHCWASCGLILFHVQTFRYTLPLFLWLFIGLSWPLGRHASIEKQNTAESSVHWQYWGRPCQDNKLLMQKLDK